MFLNSWAFCLCFPSAGIIHRRRSVRQDMYFLWAERPSFLLLLIHCVDPGFIQSLNFDLSYTAETLRYGHFLRTTFLAVSFLKDYLAFKFFVFFFLFLILFFTYSCRTKKFLLQSYISVLQWCASIVFPFCVYVGSPGRAALNVFFTLVSISSVVLCKCYALNFSLSSLDRT